MDNLKFATEFVQATDEFKEVFDRILCVYARTREDIKYQCVICDTNAIQYEKPFLLPDMVNETIIKHIESEIPAYTYDIHKDQIVINIGVLPNKGLKLVLSKDMSSLPNESARISRIESLITRLTPSEIIESHTIKMDTDHADFKKTLAFRYFEAFDNVENYFKPHPKFHLGTYKDWLYVLHTSGYPYYEQTAQGKSKYTRCTLRTDVTAAVSNYRSHLSAVKDTIESGTVLLNKTAMSYIHKYVVGFVLLNHQLLFGRNPTLEIHGTTHLTINICRSTRQTFSYIPSGGEVMGLPFPTLATLTLGDVHFDFCA